MKISAVLETSTLIHVPLHRERKCCAENYLKLCTGVLISP